MHASIPVIHWTSSARGSLDTVFLLRITLLLLISTPLAAAPYFVHCYDFGCKTTKEIQFSAQHWEEVRSIFNGVTSPAAERQAVRQAIAAMERISGQIAGTSLDKGRNYPGYDIEKQMDCIDESTNTFQYLSAIEEDGLLGWHRVDQKYRRIVWLATHWTAAITEIESRQTFAVDSWYRDNGELPYIQPLADWKRKRSFSVAYNPELADN